MIKIISLVYLTIKGYFLILNENTNYPLPSDYLVSNIYSRLLNLSLIYCISMKVKKYFLLSICTFVATAIWLSSHSTYAQDDTTLWYISIRFCNDEEVPWGTKSLTLLADADKEQEICMYMNNASNKAVKIGVNFVDGSNTADAEWKKACEPEWSKINFWQYVTIDDTAFEIPAKGTLQTRAKVKFPAGVAWVINGCVTFHLLEEETKPQEGMIKIFSRRANFIDVVVSGSIIFDTTMIADRNPSFPMIVENKDVNLYKHIISKTLSMKSLIINSGNINTQSNISWSVKGRFWILNAPLQSNPIISNAKKQAIFEIDLPKRSLFAGPLSIDLAVHHQGLLPSWFNQDTILWSDQQVSIHTWILPRWIYLAIVCFLCLMVINRLRKKSKGN